MTLLAASAAVVGGVAARAAKPVIGPGLTVGPGGVLEKDGQRYRGIGLNWPDLMFRLLAHPDSLAVQRDFRTLQANHIPFVRVPILGAWSKAQYRLWVEPYLQHPTQYFRSFDRMVALARRYHVGLIPSLFFGLRWLQNSPQLSRWRLRGSLVAWTQRNALPGRTWRRFVRQVVQRYRSSPAIWGWEFGNELNLEVDLPDAAALGIRPSYGYTHATMWKLYQQFVRLVRRYDPYRILSSGNSFPRRSSWHNMVDHTWTRDTPAEYAYMLRQDNAGFSVISVHAYGPQAAREIAQAAALAERWGKPLWVGEWGAAGPPKDSATEARQRFGAILAALVRAKVPLAAFWSFDEANQPENSVTADNARSWMLKAIGAADQRFQREGYAVY